MSASELPAVGIFGTGAATRVLVPVFRQHGFRISALWGSTQQSAEQLGRQLAIAVCTNNVDELLLRKDVDLVCIACPPNLHSQIAVKALGIGKHVLCNTPTALNQNDALKMVRAADYYPTLTAVLGHCLRFLPVMVEMRELLASGYIGKDLHVMEVRIHCSSLLTDGGYSWLCEERMGGGVLSLIGNHVIDTITFLTGRRALRANATLKTFIKQTKNINGIRNISADDFCSFQLELEGGGMAVVMINSHLPRLAGTGGQFIQDIYVCGGEGYLRACLGKLYGWKNGESKVEEEVECRESCDLVLPTTSPDLPMPYVQGLHYLVQSLRSTFLPPKSLPLTSKAGDTSPSKSLPGFASFEDGLYIQAVLDALRESNKTKEWVAVSVISEGMDPNPVLSAAAKHSVFRKAKASGSFK